MENNSATKVRINAIKKALEDFEDSGNRRTEMVPYRGQSRPLEVVRVNPDLLLLNPNNSRLRAQLEDFPDRHLVFDNPLSVEAQEILSVLLRKTGEYKKLKEELKEFDQVNPGIVSREGLLINGNTRVVALRDLGVEGVDVAVLPIDATSQDFFEIETGLQLTKLTHQDYTFTNKLLMMKAHLDHGIDKEKLGKMMGWTKNRVAKVQQHMRMLQTIMEVRKLSKNKLKYETFDSKQQHFKDLDDKYQSMLNSGKIQEAEDMKWTRIYALLLGVNKDQVRMMDGTFISDEVQKRGGDDPDLSSYVESYKNGESDPLDVLLDNDDEVSPIDVRRMVEDFVTDPTTQTSGGSLSPDLPEVHSKMEKVLRLGANAEIERENEENYGAILIDRIIDAALKMENNVQTFAERAAFGNFDLATLNQELSKLLVAIGNLQDVSSKYFESHA